MQTETSDVAVETSQRDFVAELHRRIDNLVVDFGEGTSSREQEEEWEHSQEIVEVMLSRAQSLLFHLDSQGELPKSVYPVLKSVSLAIDELSKYDWHFDYEISD